MLTIQVKLLKALHIHHSHWEQWQKYQSSFCKERKQPIMTLFSPATQTNCHYKHLFGMKMEVFLLFFYLQDRRWIYFPLCVTGDCGFNIYNTKISRAMHFLTHICPTQMNQCQINFKGARLDFDLVLWCSNCDGVPLIQLRAISLDLTDTDPS